MLTKFVHPRALAEAPKVTVRFLSDTIVIAMHLGVDAFAPDVDARVPPVIDAFLALQTIHATSLCLALAAGDENVQLNYRGAIAFGPLAIDENVLIGPAVDEAAELYERSDGPFVEVTSAVVQSAIFRPEPDNLFPAYWDTRRLLLDYQVPLKCGCAAQTWVVNPFAACPNADVAKATADGMMAAFGPDGAKSHPSKYANTLSLIERARRSWTPIEIRNAGT